MPLAKSPGPHFGAFESTLIHGSGVDVLETTRHLENCCEDLDLLRRAGVKNLRYPAPWHRIEASPDHFDFAWMDKPMQHMRREGMKPVIDLLHHTSFPEWLENGFLNPQFPRLFARFVREFARRYEWVTDYTIFNEPLATSLLCSYTGVWYPYQSSDPAFVQMGVNVARAIRVVEAELRRMNPSFEFVYNDTCESHKQNDLKSAAWTEFASHRRFWILDLVLGRVSAHHPLYKWITSNGVTSEDLKPFRNEPVQIDLLGLDYYPHSEMNWYWSKSLGRANIHSVTEPRGFAEVACDYVERYGLPVMLAETNVRGTVTDRLTWLKFMEEQCEMLTQKGVDLRGFCWFPSIDSTDWSNLCASYTGDIDPQGIWYLDASCRNRVCSELSEWYERLACESAKSADLPAYRLLPPVDSQLSGYLKLMAHWDNWIEPSDVKDQEQQAA